MHKWFSIALGLLVIAAAVGVVLRVRGPAVQETTASVIASSEPLASAAPPDAPTAADAGLESDGGPEDGPFGRLPDGGPVPELPASAPAAVRFGAILFTYRSAQFAPKDARERDEAQRLAQQTVSAAEKAFSEAVKRGDPGSTADAGRIPRGVLEPAVEYVLFTLQKDAVHPEAIDTPRGYWILKRIE